MALTEKWLEHGMGFIYVLMPALESTDSETHESAIKIKYLCICAYGSMYHGSVLEVVLINS
jgi:hypothetical protein